MKTLFRSALLAVLAFNCSAASISQYSAITALTNGQLILITDPGNSNFKMTVADFKAALSNSFALGKLNGIATAASNQLATSSRQAIFSFIGNSMASTNIVVGSNTWPVEFSQKIAAMFGTTNIYYFGKPGNLASNMVTQYDTESHLIPSVPGQPKYLLGMLPFNDIFMGDSAENCEAYISNICVKGHADGFKTVIGTETRNFDYSVDASALVVLTNVNNWILQATNLIDYCPHIDKVLTITDTGDHIHPNVLGNHKVCSAFIKAMLGLDYYREHGGDYDIDSLTVPQATFGSTAHPISIGAAAGSADSIVEDNGPYGLYFWLKQGHGMAFIQAAGNPIFRVFDSGYSLTGVTGSALATGGTDNSHNSILSDPGYGLIGECWEGHGFTFTDPSGVPILRGYNAGYLSAGWNSSAVLVAGTDNSHNSIISDSGYGFLFECWPGKGFTFTDPSGVPLLRGYNSGEVQMKQVVFTACPTGTPGNQGTISGVNGWLILTNAGQRIYIPYCQ
jgi:hypothetical protein